MLLLCLILCVVVLFFVGIVLERRLEHRENGGTSYEERCRELYLDILEGSHTQRIVDTRHKK